MSESNTKVWYQDGWLILWIVVIGAIILVNVSKPEKEPVHVHVTGRVHEPLFGSSSFELTAWHHFAGDLKRGRLTVWLRGEGVRPEKELQVYSFEAWMPNEAHSVTFQFPLETYDPTKPLTVDYRVQAENAQSTSELSVWQNHGWKQ